MHSKFKQFKSIHFAGCTVAISLVSGIVGVVALTPAPVALAQAVPAANRFVGTITASAPGTLTVKTDAGVERKVTVPDWLRTARWTKRTRNIMPQRTLRERLRWPLMVAFPILLIVVGAAWYLAEIGRAHV